MIVGAKFIWLHVPKTAGHAVDQALQASIGETRDIHFDPPGQPGWHDSLVDRAGRDPGFAVGSRIVIAGFRRLPHWVLSRIHYEAGRAPYLTASRAMLTRGEFFQRNGDVSSAEAQLLHYGDRIDRWVRSEHLAQDFLAGFEDVLGSRVAAAALRKLRRIVNRSQLNYVRDLSFYFSPKDLADLYAANPRWAELERQLYGDLLTSALRTEESFYIVDRRLRIVAISNAALRMWSCQRGAVVGRPFGAALGVAETSAAFRTHLAVASDRRAISVLHYDLVPGHRVRAHYLPQAGGTRVDIELLPRSPAGALPDRRAC